MRCCCATLYLIRFSLHSHTPSLSYARIKYIYFPVLSAQQQIQRIHTHTHSKNNNKIVRLPSIAYLCRRRCRCRRIVHAANCTNAVGKKRGCWKFMIITSAQSEPARPTPLRLARAYTIQLALASRDGDFSLIYACMHGRRERQAPSVFTCVVLLATCQRSNQFGSLCTISRLPRRRETRTQHTACIYE